MRDQLVAFLSSFVMSYLVPELLKLSAWVRESPIRTSILRLVSATLALVTAAVAVGLSGDVVGLKEVVESLIISVLAFVSAFVQHKLAKAVRQ